MRVVAKDRGGKCLSNSYVNIKSNLKWQCAYGHVWEASAEKILSGRWCHYCNDSIGERICRAFFEQAFNMSFPKVRPSWLLSVDGHRMELDGYNADLKIAFEHQGDQHFKLTYFHNEKSFNKRKENDERKRFLCKKHNVSLIEIPQIFSRTELKNLTKTIKKQLPEKYFISDSFDVDLKDVYINNKLKDFAQIAESHGGEIISEKYLGDKHKLHVKCSCGREWHAWPSNLKKGHWCASCSNKKERK